MSDIEIIQETAIIETMVERNISVSKPLHKQISFIILSVLLLITVVVGTVLLFKMSSKIEQQSDEIINFNKTLQNIHSRIDENSVKSENMTTQVDRIIELTLLSYLQHSIEDGIVTDDFYVNKITFDSKDGNLSVVIDITSQPTLLGVYEGKGTFDLPDRELRAKVIKITDMVKDTYVSNKQPNMPTWDTATATITIQNYEIGKFEKGDFKLVGEK